MNLLKKKEQVQSTSNRNNKEKKRAEGNQIWRLSLGVIHHLKLTSRKQNKQIEQTSRKSSTKKIKTNKRRQRSSSATFLKSNLISHV